MPVLGDYAFLEWTALVGYELLLFAGFFFVLGSIDDFAVDLYYLRLRMTGRARTPEIERAVAAQRPLAGSAAVMIPAWRESAVIGTTVSHALKVWPHAELQIYVGCYRNDPETVEAAMAGAAGDSRLRLVIHDCDGPSSKADCLNRIYAAIEEDEGRAGRRFRMIVLHDAEDMVDPAALSLVDAALDRADFVQIPVLPEPQRNSRWIAGHYCDEFAEAHGKALLVREALGAGLPAAGVGCAFARATLGEVASQAGHPRAPFASECLTEDYEFGLRMSQAGRGAAFLRLRGDDGRLVATRACFPPTVTDAVRQKTRWLHGIAFQGWERLGWQGRLSERWMRLRDRRAPLTAMVLAAAYALLVVVGALWLADFSGLAEIPEPDSLVKFMLALNLFSFAWRAIWRFAFTTREYGIFEGLFAILRIPVANIIAIMAGRRALLAYIRSLRGETPQWEKTEHRAHPASRLLPGSTA